MRLIPEWRKAYKLWSVQLAAIGAGLSGLAGGLVMALPAFQSYLPPFKYLVICAVVGTVAGLLRLLDQEGHDHDD